ncbi:MAG: hypothetical protein QI197_05250 [Candidatus Korarchaeota archaeon]|nr:hypothetical protein [Candidatus Korarchaeota archaeon]
MEYRDMFIGIRAHVPDGWLVLASESTLFSHHPHVPTTMIFSSRLDADSLIKELVNYVQALIGAPLNARVSRGRFIEARGYLPGTLTQQVMRTPPGEYVIRVYPGKPSWGWASHVQYLSKDLENYGKPELLNSIEARRINVPDPARGVVAFKTAVPHQSHVKCYAQGEAPVMEIRGRDYLISMIPPSTYVYGNPLIVQSYLMMGAKVSPYMDAISYMRTALTPMGIKVKDVRPAPIPGSLAHLVTAKLASTLTTGQQPMFSSAIAKLEDGYAWVTAIGENFMGSQIWAAYLYLSKGRSALWILQSIAAHFEMRQEWAKALKRESDMAYKSVLSSIRSTSRLTDQIARSLKTSQFHNYQPEYGLEDSYSEWELDSSSYDSSSYESEWEGDDVATGTGMDTFYVDSDGQVRDMDLGEDVSFYEIDGEGILRDEEGNEVGYVEDGYVYDNEGDRLGWLDASISDDWQMERLEQESSDPSAVFGYYSWGAQDNEDSTETPYYTTRDEDEEDQ